MNLFSPERTLRICTIVALAAVGAVAANGALLKGPFVILEDTERLSIRMEVEQPDYEVILIHGELERTRSKPVFSRSKRDTFLAKVGVDLKELRKFRGYEIWSEGEIIGSYDWRSRVDGTFQDYPRLLVFGDSQGGKETLSRLGKRWMQEEFDLLVALGDLVDTGSRYESWEEELFGPLSGLLPHYPILTVCGNHESYRERSFYWFDWFLGRKDDKRFFKMDFRDLRLVGINNSDVHTKYGFD
ncbi:MAG: metallophosphoesterase family protein, partial [Opitutaceae bacterium]